MKRDNQQWITDIKSTGATQAAAMQDLQDIILRSLPYALQGWLSRDHPEFESLTEEIAQEALLRILDQIDTFEGRSQFTTWANKIAVRLALSELRRRRWRDISLDGFSGDENGLVDQNWMKDPAAGPELTTIRTNILSILDRLIAEELTPKQRQALLAIIIQGMPMGEVARRMGMQRNALYKLLHDARLRLKRRIQVEQLTVQEILEAFEEK
jgi:RNA polymerase sigma-70 factor (ECF subfamily)